MEQWHQGLQCSTSIKKYEGEKERTKSCLAITLFMRGHKKVKRGGTRSPLKLQPRCYSAHEEKLRAGIAWQWRRLGISQSEGAFLFSVCLFLTYGRKKRPSQTLLLYLPPLPEALTHLISLPRQHGPSSNLTQCHSVIQQGRVLEKGMERYNLIVGSLVKVQREHSVTFIRTSRANPGSGATFSSALAKSWKHTEIQFRARRHNSLLTIITLLQLRCEHSHYNCHGRLL